jgi:ankyrin repeat protein
MSLERQVCEAIRNGELERVRVLIRSNPELAAAKDEKGVSAILLASYHRRAEIVQLLREANEGLDVFEAATVGDAERVQQLVTADLTAISGWSADGFQPLHLAAFFGHPPIVALLLANHADPNSVARNAMAVCPLHSAAANWNCETVRLLLEHGANPNAKQHGGWTALHAAALHNDLTMIRLLLDHGADPGVKSDEGKTAADLANSKSFGEAAALLGGS